MIPPWWWGSLYLALLARVWKQRPRKTMRKENVQGTMSDPFDGHPPQGVVFECRKQGCGLEHQTTVQQFSEVEDLVRYYCGQGHQAQARFPAAEDAVWPPDDQVEQD